MTNAAFITLVQWVISHGYFLFFISAFLEGPLVTAAAGVAAALGYYSIEAIIILSILADLMADTVYYAIGYWSRKALITRYGPYAGLTHERMKMLEGLLHRHGGKAMIVIKLSPVIPVPGLIMIGLMRMPLKRFVVTSLLITAPKSFLFGFIGFYAGRAYDHLGGVIASGQQLLTFIAVMVFVVYIAYKKITAQIAKNL